MSLIDDAEIHWLILDGLEVFGDSGHDEWSFTLFLHNPARKDCASKTASGVLDAIQVIQVIFFAQMWDCQIASVNIAICNEIRSFSIRIWDPLPLVIAASSED